MTLHTHKEWWVWQFSTWIIAFHTFIVGFCIPVSSITYSPTLMFFSAITNISACASNCGLTSVFFRHACHLNPGAEKNKHHLVHKFPATCLWNLPVYLKTTEYQPVQIYCDIGRSYKTSFQTLLVCLHSASVMSSIVRFGSVPFLFS